MRMLIHSSGGRAVEATMLFATPNMLRVAIDGGEDAMELRWISGHWISETNDPVELEFREEETGPRMVN